MIDIKSKEFYKFEVMKLALKLYQIEQNSDYNKNLAFYYNHIKDILYKKGELE